MASNASRTAALYRAKGQRAEEAARNARTPEEAARHRARAARHFERADHFTAVRNAATRRRCMARLADTEAES